MKPRLSLLVVLSLILVSFSVGLGQAQGPAPQGMLGTAFSYQGQLKQNGLPVSGTCDFWFHLWDAETDGLEVVGAQNIEAVPVSKGLFTVLLDFGPYAFNGDARWLGIEVRCPAGAGAYTPLAPRQPLTPTPYAIFASSAPWSGLLDRPAGLDDGDDDTLAALMCAEDEVPKWDGAAWVCAPDDDALRGLACALGQVVKWDGTSWVCADDEDTASVYTAGDGLVLTGNEFSVDFAGTGTATTAARSDHDHDAVYVNEGQPDSITSAMIWNGGVNPWDLRDGACLTELADDDGAGSGLDADFLDGLDSTAFAAAGHDHDGDYVNEGQADSITSAMIVNGTVQAADLQDGAALAEILDDDGHFSGLDADLLDGYHGGYYRDASNINAGTLGTDYYSAYADLTAEGVLDNDAGTDLLTRDQADGRYLTGGTAWLLNGNAGTNPLTNFLGTTDAVSLTLAVSGTAALRLEPNATSPNVIGGYAGNSVAAGIYGATIGGGGKSGSINQVSANYGTVGGGRGNTASGDYAAVGGGLGNTASGDLTTVGGGWENTASGKYSTVPGGLRASAPNYGQMAYASGAFNTPGDAQTSLYVMRGVTTSGVASRLWLDGSWQSLPIPSGKTVAFDILVVGRSDAGESGAYQIYALMENMGGTLTRIASTTTVIGEDDIAWHAEAAADNITNTLNLSVQGNGETIRWVASVRTSEVSW